MIVTYVLTSATRKVPAKQLEGTQNEVPKIM